MPRIPSTISFLSKQKPPISAKDLFPEAFKQESARLAAVARHLFPTGIAKQQKQHGRTL